MQRSEEAGGNPEHGGARASAYRKCTRRVSLAGRRAGKTERSWPVEVRGSGDLVPGCGRAGLSAGRNGSGKGVSEDADEERESSHESPLRRARKPQKRKRIGFDLADRQQRRAVKNADGGEARALLGFFHAGRPWGGERESLRTRREPATRGPQKFHADRAPPAGPSVRACHSAEGEREWAPPARSSERPGAPINLPKVRLMLQMRMNTSLDDLPHG